MTRPDLAGSRLRLAALGAAVVASIALGGPALRHVGDNAFIALAIVAGLLTFAALDASGRAPDDRATLALIVAIGLALRLIALAQPPLLSDDIYRYVWDGRVQAAGINPYRFVPADPALHALRDEAIFPFINRADYAPTIYPPVAQAFFLAVTRVTGTVTGMRVAAVLCELATVAALLGLLRLTGRPGTRVVAYLWHPLPVWEIANNGHVDALTVALATTGLWLALAGGRRLSGAAAIALGALVKPTALLALPPLWRPWDWRMVATVALVAALAYLPYLSVGSGVFGFLAGGYFSEQGIASGDGFWLLRVWRSGLGIMPHDAAAYIALSGAIVAGLALRAGFRRTRDPGRVLADVATLLVAFLLLLSSEYPWYMLPLVPFLALMDLPVGWAMTVGIFAFYDVAHGDAVVPFHLRAGAFNLVVLPVLVYGWWRRSGETGR